MNVPSPHQDWPKDQIVDAIHRAGYSLVDLDVRFGLSDGAVAHALRPRRPWPRVKRLVAEAIGVKPQVIWPSIFDAQGNVRRNREGRPRDGSTKASKAPAGAHVRNTKVA